MVPPNAELLLVTAPDKEMEAVQRFARIGYNQVCVADRNGYQ